MRDSLLFFNPYIGDTILATALAKKVEDRYPDECVYVASLNEEMRELTDMLGGKGFTYHYLEEFLLEGSKVGPVIKQYQGGTDFSYSFSPTPEEEEQITMMCENIIYHLDVTFECFLTLHYSYAFAKLGQIAKKHGLSVYGYCLDENNRLYFSRDTTPLEVVSLWDKGFIGERLSRLLTGLPITSQDYASIPRTESKGKVLLFPTTRSLNTNAGNWELDVQVLAKAGVDFQVWWHWDEETPNFIHQLSPNRYGRFTTVFEMIELIRGADYIICYDSASFHLAYLAGVPAIVKLKGGFNEEWIPEWIKDDKNYYFIPALTMYEEEYMNHLFRGLVQIGAKL